MTAPKVVIDPRGKGAATFAQNPDLAWRAVGWLGLLLAVVGLGDFVLAFIPTAFHTPEWEFATVASVFAGLPLPTLGLAGMLAAGYARGRRRMVLGMGAVLFILALVFLWLLMLFVTDVPIALKSGAQPEVLLGLQKAIAKTILMGVAFSLAYLVAGFRAIRAGWVR